MQTMKKNKRRVGKMLKMMMPWKKSKRMKMKTLIKEENTREDENNEVDIANENIMMSRRRIPKQYLS